MNKTKNISTRNSLCFKSIVGEQKSRPLGLAIHSSPYGLVKKYRGGGGSGGPEHLEVWLIKKKTRGQPLPFGTKMTDPPPKARLEIA